MHSSKNREYIINSCKLNLKLGLHRSLMTMIWMICYSKLGMVVYQVR